MSLSRTDSYTNETSTEAYKTLQRSLPNNQTTMIAQKTNITGQTSRLVIKALSL